MAAAIQLRARPLDDAPAVLEDCVRLGGEAVARGAQLIVFPEGTYPGYVLGSVEAGRAAVDRHGDPVASFAAVVRALGRWVVVGLAVRGSERLRNVAVLFDPRGRAVGLVGKQRPWHFDSRWYEPCAPEGHWRTPFGPIAAMICADARAPELVAARVAGGARLLCNPTAWVTAAPGSGRSIQPEFLLAARAIENAVPVVAASKAGREGIGTAYAGRSQIVAADGRILAEAPAQGEACLVERVELGPVRPTTGVPVPPRPWPAAPCPPVARIGVATGLCGATADDLDALDLDLLVVGGLGEATPPTSPWDNVTVGGHAPPLRGSGGAARSAPVEVALTAGGTMRVVAIDERRALDPMVARAGAGDGVDLLVLIGEVAEAVVRARAAENRLFVAHASETVARLIDPSGAILAGVVEHGLVMSADAHLATARCKRLAPGTSCAP